MMKQNNAIDLVVLWVDGSDLAWIEQFQKYQSEIHPELDARPIRFRDWQWMPYWFRAVERNLPWIRTIHFVTNGQFPQWLKTDHSKLNWVRHEDIIPSDALPVFNSNAIEMNVHRIEKLSEQFILCNDDFFFLKPLFERAFFHQGKPCDCAVHIPMIDNGVSHITSNNISIINKHFDKHHAMRKHVGKWLHPCYGIHAAKSLLTWPFPYFSGLLDTHLPQPYLKSSFINLWKKEPHELTKTIYHRFRSSTDISHWLVRYWQLVSGNFHPYPTFKNGCCVNLSNKSITEIEQLILTPRYAQLIINDSDNISDPETVKRRLLSAFEKQFPKKSSFEI